jgi:AcrR family transcriptional regulator
MLAAMASKAQGRETRARVVDEATKAFSERGLRDVSLTEIAAAAGVTRQGLLHYFPSKTDLVLAVLTRRDRDDTESVPRAAMQSGDLPTALRAILGNDFEHPGLTRLFVSAVAESLQPEHPTHEHFRHRYARGRDVLSEVIRRRQERGEVTDRHEPEAIAIALLALLAGLNLQQVLEPDIEHGPALDVILDLLFNA